jgi:hypothetical protein
MPSLGHDENARGGYLLPAYEHGEDVVAVGCRSRQTLCEKPAPESEIESYKKNRRKSKNRGKIGGKVEI